MTFKEEKYEYVNIPCSILGSNNFWDMLKFTQPKPNENEHFEFVMFDADFTRSDKKTICYFWIYKVYER